MILREAKGEEKKDHLERLLDKGTVMIFLDSRRPEVIVPDHHKGNPQLPLNLDYSFQIPDFTILDSRVEVSLSFNRTPFFCQLPFSAIYAMRSEALEEVVVFPESVPKDDFGRISEGRSDRGQSREDQAASLKIVASSNEEKKESTAKKSKKTNHLKLVKN